MVQNCLSCKGVHTQDFVHQFSTFHNIVATCATIAGIRRLSVKSAYMYICCRIHCGPIHAVWILYFAKFPNQYLSSYWSSWRLNKTFGLLVTTSRHLSRCVPLGKCHLPLTDVFPPDLSSLLNLSLPSDLSTPLPPWMALWLVTCHGCHPHWHVTTLWLVSLWQCKAAKNLAFVAKSVVYLGIIQSHNCDWSVWGRDQNGRKKGKKFSVSIRSCLVALANRKAKQREN